MKVTKLLLSLVIMCGGAVLVARASAMTFQDSVDVQFSFDVSLEITLSSNWITIDNLSPGNYAHSNTITATVVTNNAYGYTLSAMVGGASQTAANNTLYNSALNASFSSLATNASTLLADFQDNEWGYTTASVLDDASYSGLAYNTNKTLNKTVNHGGTPVTGYQGTDTTSFTIGARAASDQLSGEYSNVITFTAVSNVATDFTINDITYMQDFAKLNSDERAGVLASMTAGDQYTLIDARDNKEYFISKLADGHVWMTQNLDLCVGCTGTAALTSDNTDLNQFDAKNYDSSNGYTCTNSEAADCEGGIITWTPERATIAKDDLNNTIWQNSNSDPYSYRYGETVLDGANAYEGHKYVGTYYNWSAAIASNNSAAFSANTLGDISGNPQNSVCPKGWRLPTIANNTTYPGTEPNSPNEFRRLNVLYNGNVTNNATNLMNAPLYLSRSGNVIGGSVINSGSYAVYWSSTVYNGNVAYLLYFNAYGIGPESSGSRNYGFSVRCVAR